MRGGSDGGRRRGQPPLHVRGNIHVERQVSPRASLQRSFLSGKEVDELFAYIGRAAACWEAVSAEQATCELELEAAAPLARSAIMAKIDARVSATLGVPLSHLEFGYVQRYTANYTLHNVHLDQGTQDMVPARVSSALIYLDDQPHGSGHTVFPLAAPHRQPSSWLSSCAAGAGVVCEAAATAWNQRLRAGRIVRRVSLVAAALSLLCDP